MSEFDELNLARNGLEEDCCTMPSVEEEDCCAVPEAAANREKLPPALCPQCGSRGRRVDLITPKSLLLPSSLERLVPPEAHYFCGQLSCQTVYFSESRQYAIDELKVPVFQKDHGADVPVCYCFGWTRERIAGEIARDATSSAAQRITEHVQAGRCACEVNNPQGSCCLGNVTTVAKQAMKGSRQPVAS